MSDLAHANSVLIVDDDFMLLEIVTSVFQQAGLRVLAASSGEAALTMLREKGSEIDWLMTDINLPGLVDGWSVADEYRLSYAERPVIYLSASTCHERRTVAGSLFVEKPLKVDELMRLARMMNFATAKAA